MLRQHPPESAMAKKLLLPIASAFLVWQSYELLTHIHELEGRSCLLLFFLAWVINLYLTGIFAFLGFAYPTQRLLPAAYYRIHRPETLRAVYKWLKVGVFRKLLLATFWRSKRQRTQYFNGTRAGMATLAEHSRKSEFGHLIPFVLITLVSVYLLGVQLEVLGGFTILFNVVGNLYPIILQRHHRMRIQAIKTPSVSRKQPGPGTQDRRPSR